MRVYRLNQALPTKKIKTGSTIIDTAEWRYICIPTMIGCPVRCTFCPSSDPGQPYLGKVASEMMEEMILDGLRQPHLSTAYDQKIEVSLTGEGEAVLNAENVILAIKKILQHHRIDRVRIACSGIGMHKLFELVQELSKLVPVRILFSLHIPEDDHRKVFIPNTIDLEEAKSYLARCTPYCDEISINMVHFPTIHYTDTLANLLRNWIAGNNWKIQIQPLITGHTMTTAEERVWDDHKNTWIPALQRLGLKVIVFEKICAAMQSHFYHLTYQSED